MKGRIIVLVVAATLMAVVTLVTYSDLGTVIFNRGSQMFTVRRISLMTMVGAAVSALLFSAVVVRVKPVAVYYSAVVAALLVWVALGRVIGISWDGRIGAGWFCFRTTTIELVEPGDGEDYARSWQVLKLPGWRLALHRNSGRVERVFVGPVLLGPVEKLLDEWGLETPIEAP